MCRPCGQSVPSSGSVGAIFRGRLIAGIVLRRPAPGPAGGLAAGSAPCGDGRIRTCGIGRASGRADLTSAHLFDPARHLVTDLMQSWSRVSRNVIQVATSLLEIRSCKSWVALDGIRRSPLPIGPTDLRQPARAEQQQGQHQDDEDLGRRRATRTYRAISSLKSETSAYFQRSGRCQGSGERNEKRPSGCRKPYTGSYNYACRSVARASGRHAHECP